jgi:hypothetical protein
MTGAGVVVEKILRRFFFACIVVTICGAEAVAWGGDLRTPPASAFETAPIVIYMAENTPAAPPGRRE